MSEAFNKIVLANDVSGLSPVLLDGAMACEAGLPENVHCNRMDSISFASFVAIYSLLVGLSHGMYCKCYVVVFPSSIMWLLGF